MKKNWALIGLMLTGWVMADDCSDLARTFADASQSMRVGDLGQLRDCVADSMQRKAQNMGDLPNLPPLPGSDGSSVSADVSGAHINLNLSGSGSGDSGSAYQMPPQGVLNH